MKLDTPSPWLLRFIALPRPAQIDRYRETLLRVLTLWHKLSYAQMVGSDTVIGRNPAYEKFEAYVTSWQFDFWYHDNPYCTVRPAHQNPYIEEERAESIRVEEIVFLMRFGHRFFEPTHAFSLNVLLRKSVDLLLEYDDVRIYLISIGEEE